MSQTNENLAPLVSSRLREWIHDVNNALFVTKGFLEEIEEEVKCKGYQTEDFDHENFVDMLSTVLRNVEKIDRNLQKLRKYAKEEIFELGNDDDEGPAVQVAE